MNRMLLGRTRHLAEREHIFSFSAAGIFLHKWPEITGALLRRLQVILHTQLLNQIELRLQPVNVFFL